MTNEDKKMLKVIIIFNIISIMGLITYVFYSQSTKIFVLHFVVGNLMGFINLLLLIKRNSVLQYNSNIGKSYFLLGYGMRMLGLFLVLFVLLKFFEFHVIYTLGGLLVFQLSLYFGQIYFFWENRKKVL